MRLGFAGASKWTGEARLPAPPGDLPPTALPSVHPDNGNPARCQHQQRRPHEHERGDISNEMCVLARVEQRLPGHDETMHDAGPAGE